ncbi:MAG TPA: hypothetical protein VKY92_03825 [Verrucomicrobiae bacterium]|nr:hypothetical protein [Verrucomicrobiae bacterium]
MSPYDNNPDNTNTVVLAQSFLQPYLGYSFGLWRCPSDLSTAREGQTILPRVRSYAMNSMLNCAFDPGQYLMQPFKVIRSTYDMMNPAPCDTFVIVEEREDSIDDGSFGVDMWNEPAGLVELPAARHKGCANLVFADNHVEPHGWLDPRTQPPMAAYGFIDIPWVPGPPNPDVLWLRAHCTGLR